MSEIYTLVLEDDITVGMPLIYLGYGHFHYNITPPGERKDKEFIIMYCKPADYGNPEEAKLVIGYSLVNKSKGDNVQWNLDDNTEDITNHGEGNDQDAP